jgi:rod shape-determining protein MreC
VAALLALLQINAARTGQTSPLSSAGLSVVSFVEDGVSIVASTVSATFGAVVQLPQLEHDVASLRTENRALALENARLHQLAAEYENEVTIRPLVDLYPKGVEARVVGFPPENESRTVTIDRGSSSGIRKDDGVIADGGVVGKVVEVTPFSSQVMLVTDYMSRLPAVTRHGRYWGIARGNLASVRVEYLPQDAPIKVGQIVVTGAGMSFHAGIPIGTIVRIERSDSTLYQTAILQPSVNLDTLDHVVVLPK